MSTENDFLKMLESHADERGAIAETPEELAILIGMDTQHVLRRCWTLQKMGVLYFRERRIHSGVVLRNLRLRGYKKTSRAEALFTLSLHVAVNTADDDRIRKLEAAAKLLDEAGEFALAVLSLEAIAHPQKEFTAYRPSELYWDHSQGRLIRRLTPEEVKELGW